MCGIVGYVGDKDASSIIINGLKRLEYRGYDSAGIALVGDDIFIHKKNGKISVLEKSLDDGSHPDIHRYHTGIGHTRWATHGAPSDRNAHPHTDCENEIALVHNGIIENFASIKKMLVQKGHTIRSDTDTEVIAHLIEYHYRQNNDLLDAVMKAVSRLEGTYGLCIVSKREPGRIIAARNGSPLILGAGDGEMIIASDASAIIEHTNRVIYLADGEIIDVTGDTFKTYGLDLQRIDKKIEDIDWDITSIEKAGFDHFMLKEIFEQPETIRNAFRGRAMRDTGSIRLDGLRLSEEELNEVRRVIFIACGTSWHAGLIGEYLIEEYARIPVEVEYASEFRYRKPILMKGDLVIVISQSGETADTLAALREARSKGIKVLGITNVVGSTIARECDGGIYIHAGPEIGVASTKAFTSQVTVLIMLALMLAHRHDLTAEELHVYIEQLHAIPDMVREVLSSSDYIRSIAEQLKSNKNFLYLGRGVNFPVALEGALKLKEISYIHAEGYPAAEMKHGPIALIDENMPVVFIAPKDIIYDKIVSNMEEVKARGGKIIAIATTGDEDIRRYSDHVIYVPEVRKMVSPLLTVVPLQLLAYHIAVLRGCDVDQPRNLAKSVTVE
ncbi:MAG: glutamine--fructose-6-phosphate transaminase (isomerizing) [Spirochaetes bacterium]|nr:glutamine--fructose-6-phosphate transaminase (isomerizing) [Spirochaetota bacterium]